MAQELLVFDAAGSNADGSDPGNNPLSIMTTTYRVLAHSYASPEELVLFASSVDTEGDIRASSRPVNRTITITVEMIETNGSILRALQSKVAKIRREGGTLKRTDPYSDVVIFDLITAGPFEPKFDIAYYSSNKVEVELTFVAKPYAREPSVTSISSNASTGVINTQTISTVSGDVGGLGNLIITDTSGADQLWTVWGVQSRFYDSAATAALFFEAETRTRLNGAVIGTFAAGGASGGGSNNMVALAAFSSSEYTAMLSTQATGGGAHLTHQGSYRVFARTGMALSNPSTLSYVLEWGVGDFRSFKRNAPYTVPTGVEMTICDLGMITIPPGTTRWEGRILVKGDSVVAGDTGIVDSFYLVPVDEGSGEITASYAQASSAVYTARDEFDQTSGALNGKTLNVGGTWATAGGTTDLTVSGSGYVTRSTVSDTAARVAVTSAAAVGAQAVKMLIGYAGPIIGAHGGPVVRYVSTSNYVAVECFPNFGSGWNINLVKFTGGATFTYLDQTYRGELDNNGVIYAQVAVSSTGSYAVWAWNESQGTSAPETPIMTGYNSILASGGANATGKIGFYDFNSGASTGTRTYDTFTSWSPVFDAAVFGSQSATVAWNGVTREDSGGSFSVPVSKYEGDYFLVPPMMGESRSIRYVVVTSRGGPGRFDGALDAKTVQMTYTKRRLVVQ